MNYAFNHHHRHHNRTSSEDRSGGFFFLDTTKSWLHSELFTAIFLISLASRDKIDNGAKCSPCMDTVTFELKLALAEWYLARSWYRLWFVTWALDFLYLAWYGSMFSHRCLVSRLMFPWVSRSRSRLSILRWMLLLINGNWSCV